MFCGCVREKYTLALKKYTLLVKGYDVCNVMVAYLCIYIYMPICVYISYIYT